MSRLLYAVVCPLHPLTVGGAFPRREWPLHVTLLGNFEWPGTEAELIVHVAGGVEGRLAIDTVVGNEAMFGPDRTITVNTLMPHSDLTDLHEALIDDRMAFVEPQYLRAGYQPHITHFPSGRRNAGDRVRLGQVVLAEMVGAEASIRAVWHWR